jgi:hypothetical protein
LPAHRPCEQTLSARTASRAALSCTLCTHGYAPVEPAAVAHSARVHCPPVHITANPDARTGRHHDGPQEVEVHLSVWCVLGWRVLHARSWRWRWRHVWATAADLRVRGQPPVGGALRDAGTVNAPVVS